MKKKFKKILNSNLILPILLTINFWIKSLIAYTFDFALGVSSPLQVILLLINPLPLAFVIFLLPLLIKNPKIRYIIMIILATAESALILFNVIYYREFTDFMTVNTILGYSKVSNGLSASSINLLKPHDIFYVLDLIVIAGILIYHFLIHKKNSYLTQWYAKISLITKKGLESIICVSIATFFLLLSFSEIDRPQLLLRTFDRNYIVKYLGINAFTFYDGFKTVQNKNINGTKIVKNINKVSEYKKENYLKANPKYFGIARGKNVFVIHLESFQQFLLNYHFEGREVTPFLNSLIKNKNTLSFDNFFHEVGQGKTSDAETMLETGLFGLPQGSFFNSLAQNNTLQAAPAILSQNGNYTSAVFHGNTAGFWNRNNVYKSMGYDYFFYNNYYYLDNNSEVGYGIKDKLLFGESIKYLEHLPQPFYAKYITVTNHFPFNLDKNVDDFPLAKTDDQVVNNYFRTAHYLDSALAEFFNYLKTSGILKKSIIVIYGDHFGISNDRNKSLAPLLNKDPNQWNNYQNAMLQRVPLIIYNDGLKGGVNHTFGGEIDVLPTLLHLLGIDTKNYIQLGQDLLNPKHNQIVAFRNHNFVSPKYTFYDGTIYNTKDGETLDPSIAKTLEFKNMQKKVNNKLKTSDLINNFNLLRFYTPVGFQPVNPIKYNYKNQYEKLLNQEKEAKVKNPSIFIQKSHRSTTENFHSSDPELIENPEKLIDPPASINQSNTKN